MILRLIRTSFVSKVLSVYLSMMLLFEIALPSVYSVYALTGGPSQPEFNSFTPIETSDLVNVSSGDYTYNIPLMDVGGYPINLSYDSGISMDQEASFVGLGWNINVGQIKRQVRGIPDDFDGSTSLGDQKDEMIYENYLKDNVTRGANVNLDAKIGGANNLSKIFGASAGIGVGMGVSVNNYTGTSFEFSKSISVSANIGPVTATSSKSTTASALDGATVSRSVGMSLSFKQEEGLNASLGVNVGNSTNSRTGITTQSISKSINVSFAKTKKRAAVAAVAATETTPAVAAVEAATGTGSAGGGLSNSTSVSFAHTSYTPSKPVQFSTKSNTLKIGVGGVIGVVYLGGAIRGYERVQKVKNRIESVPAYGYLNTNKLIGTTKDNDEIRGVLDFNREKERTVSYNTNILPITNNTFDLYSINGQGISGMFRGYKNSLEYNADRSTGDVSTGKTFGGDVGLGFGGHVGIEYKKSKSGSNVGAWLRNNEVVEFVDTENKIGFQSSFEPVYFKTIGGLSRDDESYEDLQEVYGGMSAYTHKVNGGKFKRNLSRQISETGTNHGKESDSLFLKAFKREGIRRKRNTYIQKISKSESLLDPLITSNLNAKDHHIAGFKVFQPTGALYVFGHSAYNTKKVEYTFDVSGVAKDKIDPGNGLIEYNTEDEGRKNYSTYSSRYYNRIVTPSFAHTYLLSSILSPDYQDLTNNGVTDDDLGSFTKIDYEDFDSQYSWRVPYESNKAVFNEGLKSSKNDDKGNVICGTKEIKYIKSISNKTHICTFEYTDRFDSKGSGGSVMKKIESISLYAKQEYLKEGGGAIPIKKVHFVYDYSLCKGVPNTSIVEGGKLTLKKVYFTYGSSFLGKYTPYTFDYSSFNPDYLNKSYDSWGNYKPYNIANPAGKVKYNRDADSPLLADEFPFVNQQKTIQDQLASAWCLEKINLPSGGSISLEIESDDYKSVQDKKAMKMFKVLGLDNSGNASNKLYESIVSLGNNINNENKEYVWVEVDDHFESTDEAIEVFKEAYLGDLIDKPIYFRFLLNMNKRVAHNYDYVTGYFEVNKQKTFKAKIAADHTSVGIPIKLRKLEGGVRGGDLVNPIAKSGWYFARKYLNAVAYTGYESQKVKSFKSAIKGMSRSLKAMSEIASGPNGVLRNRNCAKYFVPNKSWIRLYTGGENKLGGGLRVASVKLNDNWNTHTDSGINKVYGQRYNYELNPNVSSGVATYEPIGCKENPFVEPLFDSPEKLIAPSSENYVEAPLGESFFPSPSITYSNVSISSVNNDNENIITHATGKTTKEFYTSKDFPTITAHTEIQKVLDKNTGGGFLKKLINIKTKEHLTMAQGFMVHTNDMDGKAKSVHSFDTKGKLISSKEFLYKTKEISNGDGEVSIGLDNKLTFLEENGSISSGIAGVEHELMNDFREVSTYSELKGYTGNLDFIPVILGFIPLITVIKDYTRDDSKLNFASTMKLVNSQGVLEKVITKNQGISNEVKNLAWDENTGEVLLTEEVNTFNRKVYNLSIPAYWKYKGMSPTYKKTGLSGTLLKANSDFIDLSSLLEEGDIVKLFKGEYEDKDYSLFWVVKKGNGRVITLNDHLGNLQGKEYFSLEDDRFAYEIYKSSHKNRLGEKMETLTMGNNPLAKDNEVTKEDLEIDFDETTKEYVNRNENIFNDIEGGNAKIINASAIVYQQEWKDNSHFSLNKFKSIKSSESDNTEYHLASFNQYVHNTKGNWRASGSYAYLAGRTSSFSNVNTQMGYYTDFKPFYLYNKDKKVWEENITKAWKAASTVTKYNPYGLEIENKDALNRYSSAQYGYENLLPIAVASNAKYSEMAFDNFEDYNEDHGSFNKTEKHLNFNESNSLAKNNIKISNKNAHTGTHSIILNGKESVTINKNFKQREFVVNDDYLEYDVVENFSKTEDVIYVDVLKNDSFSFEGASLTDAFEIFNDGEAIDNSVTEVFKVDNGTKNNPYDDKIGIRINPVATQQVFPVGHTHLIPYKIRNSSLISHENLELTGVLKLKLKGSLELSNQTIDLSQEKYNELRDTTNGGYEFGLTFSYINSQDTNQESSIQTYNGIKVLTVPILQRYDLSSDITTVKLKDFYFNTNNNSNIKIYRDLDSSGHDFVANNHVHSEEIDVKPDGILKRDSAIVPRFIKVRLPEDETSTIISFNFTQVTKKQNELQELSKELNSFIIFSK